MQHSVESISLFFIEFSKYVSKAQHVFLNRMIQTQKKHIAKTRSPPRHLGHSLPGPSGHPLNSTASSYQSTPLTTLKHQACAGLSRGSCPSSLASFQETPAEAVAPTPAYVPVTLGTVSAAQGTLPGLGPSSSPRRPSHGHLKSIQPQRELILSLLSAPTGGLGRVSYLLLQAQHRPPCSCTTSRGSP